MQTMTPPVAASGINAAIDKHIEEHLPYWIEQLARLCAQPSISAQNVGIEACAQLVAEMLQEQGFNSEVMASDGYPVVYGEGQGTHDKTMLFYLHYDVQPPEPLSLWESPPFRLAMRDDKLFARGVSDDKGHIITRLAALAAVRHAMGALPCNIKFLVEGEEEIASPNMPAFINQHQNKFAADACIWEFGGVNHDGLCTVSLGMRGIAFVELSVRTASRDVHSGLGGSIFPNAAWRLTWALNTLKDQNEHILIDGFYDNVIPPTPRDRDLLAQLPDEADKLREMYDLSNFLNGLEGGVTLRETAVFQPTCTICGLNAGYLGKGTKTVLPAQATAKIDFRLVPDQSPQEIVAKLRAHLDNHGFNDIEVALLGGCRPARVDPDNDFVQLAIKTAHDVYGQQPVIEPIIGGSGPNYPFIHVLNVPVVTSGIGYPGGRVHAPNENIRIDDFIKGIRHTAYMLANFHTL